MKKINKVDVVCQAVTPMPTKYGTFTAHGYENPKTGEHHIALVKGDIADGEPVLCRVHSECLTGDTFGSLRCDCGEQLLVQGDGGCDLPEPVLFEKQP